MPEKPGQPEKREPPAAQATEATVAQQEWKVPQEFPVFLETQDPLVTAATQEALRRLAEQPLLANRA
jgi:hypothetical protein